MTDSKRRKFHRLRCRPIAPPPSTPYFPWEKWERWSKFDGRAADERRRYHQRLRAGQPADSTIPLPTGSFTGLAILSPGVNAELPGGTGANSGLGQSADLGQWPARYQQQFPAQRRRCQQSVQWQEHKPGGLRPHREQHRCRRMPPAPRQHRCRALRLSISRLAKPCRRLLRRRFRNCASTLPCTMRNRDRPAARTST